MPKGLENPAAILSDKLSTNTNRMTKNKIADFTQTTGKSPGEWLNERGITSTGEQLIDDLTKNAKKSIENADDAVSIIEGNFKMDTVMGAD